MDTERLYLRCFSSEDWANLYEYLSDERVVKYEPYPPQTEAQCKWTAEQRSRSNDFWAVCLKENDKLIGNIYLAPRQQASWEIGYVFNYAYHHKGYATEAVEALIDKLFSENSTHRVYAECNPENTPSWRLLERLGFRREGHLKKNIYFSLDNDGTPLWQDTYIYGLLREER